MAGEDEIVPAGREGILGESGRVQYILGLSTTVNSEASSIPFIPSACAECGDSLPFSGASSILPYHILFPATLLRQLCFHPPSLRPTIYFLVYLLVLLFPNSYTILF